jgi:hypothetical protein
LALEWETRGYSDPVDLEKQSAEMPAGFSEIILTM